MCTSLPTPRIHGIPGAEPGDVKTTVYKFMHDEAGQTATEYMLIISVIVIAVVAAAYVFVPSFQTGVSKLASDVSTILDGGCINGCANGGGRAP
jgi:Flp pilus assembly pilin Flp